MKPTSRSSVPFRSLAAVLLGACSLLSGTASAAEMKPEMTPMKVADFTVESPVDGKRFRLSEAKGRFVALQFLLKTECPICLRHTHEAAKKAAVLPDVVQVFLKPDSAEEIRRWAEKAPTNSVTVYRDADATLAKRLGIPGGYEFHGEKVHYPALVLIGPAGHEVFRHVGKSNADRYSFDQLAAKVAELKAMKPTMPEKPMKP
jgi:peroxiredoxin Q/BCP